jgi:DNA (cytosine-5)-methyltransferase 1
MNHGSLFSGIGGFDLAAAWMGWNNVFHCEIDPFCRKVLRKHWPEVPQYDDIRTLNADRLAADGIAVDAICGGFPCQPFSGASRGRRVAADLWPEMLRIVGSIKPKIIIGENVQELPLRRAAHEFGALGYRTVVKRISADDVGADHQRSRWWVCAYTHDKGELYSAINAEVARVQEVRQSIWGWANYARAIRVPDGLPYRMDRNRALGNAVLPIIPELWGRAIMMVGHGDD